VTATRLSIVIPALNEGVSLARNLPRLVTHEPDAEVVVVDGGSEDDSCEVVARVPSVQWVVSARGRARQMNAGVRLTCGDVLLFLHADTVLPGGAGAAIRAALVDGAVIGASTSAWTVRASSLPSSDG
jgi:glycosyltransferase involved in cell wall biosynthesis